MTAEQKYTPAAQAVINDYLDRLKYRLAGFPPVDREDLLREIACHIDEAFAAEAGGDEMERLLRVLRRLGEPADVISERMSPAMIRLGKNKGLPFYILSGMLIAFVGLPLGLGAALMLIIVLAAIFGLLVAYFVTGFSFLVSGVAGMIVSAILLLGTHSMIDRINEAFGGNGGVHLMLTGTALNLPPQVEAALTFIVCAILTGLGALMIWGGRYLLRGIGYLFRISWQKLREILESRRRSPAARQPTWATSVWPL